MREEVPSGAMETLPEHPEALSLHVFMYGLEVAGAAVIATAMMGFRGYKK